MCARWSFIRSSNSLAEKYHDPLQKLNRPSLCNIPDNAIWAFSISSSGEDKYKLHSCWFFHCSKGNYGFNTGSNENLPWLECQLETLILYDWLLPWGDPCHCEHILGIRMTWNGFNVYEVREHLEWNCSKLNLFPQENQEYENFTIIPFSIKTLFSFTWIFSSRMQCKILFREGEKLPGFSDDPMPSV